MMICIFIHAGHIKPVVYSNLIAARIIKIDYKPMQLSYFIIVILRKNCPRTIYHDEVKVFQTLL